MSCFSFSFQYNLVTIGVLEFVVVIDVYAQPTREKIKFYRTASQNWRGRPLTSRLAVVELIAATTTTTGLTVACEIDDTEYPKGIKVTGAEMDGLSITRDNFHPEWNYTISPRTIDRAVILA